MAFEGIFSQALDSRVFIAVVGIAAFYLAFRLLFASSGRKSASYHKEIERIINSDEHKVKGRFEE